MLRALWTGPNPHNVKQNDTIVKEFLRGSRIFPFWRSTVTKGPHTSRRTRKNVLILALIWVLGRHGRYLEDENSLGPITYQNIKSLSLRNILGLV